MYRGIEQLRGSSNYDTWRHYARALLKFDGLAGHLTQSVEQQPADERAQCTVILALSPAVLHVVDGDGMSAKQMWDKLAAAYSRPSAATSAGAGR